MNLFRALVYKFCVAAACYKICICTYHLRTNSYLCFGSCEGCSRRRAHLYIYTCMYICLLIVIGSLVNTNNNTAFLYFPYFFAARVFQILMWYFRRSHRFSFFEYFPFPSLFFDGVSPNKKEIISKLRKNILFQKKFSLFFFDAFIICLFGSLQIQIQ